MRPQLLLKPLSLALLLAGCGSGVPDDEVHLTRVDHYLTPEGTLERSGGFDDVELLVPTDSGYTRMPVTAEQPGRARVRAVPEGPVLVRVGQTYVLTGADERHLELGVYRAERPDTQYSRTDFLRVQLNVNGLQPWQEAGVPEGPSETGSMDELYAVAPGTGNTLAFHDTYLPTGQTTLEDPEALLFSTSSLSDTLPQLSSERDSLVVAQLSLHRTQTLEGAAVHYSAVRRAQTVVAPTFTGAEPRLTLDVALQDVPQRTLRADLRGAAFANLATSVHPAATLGYQALSILPAAYGLEHGWVGEMGTLLTTGWRGLPVADVAVDLEYGNPFPAGWGDVAVYNARYLIPVGTSGGSFSAYLQVVDSAERLDGRAVVPVVSPPRNVTLDGQPPAQGRTLGSLTPTVAWEPPALGTPSHYEVWVAELPFAFVRALLRVPAGVHQLRLPEGILKPGRAYSIRASAYVAGSWKERPLDYPFPNASADAALGHVWTPGTFVPDPEPQAP